jgi:hypothetical protein
MQIKFTGTENGALDALLVIALIVLLYLVIWLAV